MVTSYIKNFIYSLFHQVKCIENNNNITKYFSFKVYKDGDLVSIPSHCLFSLLSSGVHTIEDVPDEIITPILDSNYYSPASKSINTFLSRISSIRPDVNTLVKHSLVSTSSSDTILRCGNVILNSDYTPIIIPYVQGKFNTQGIFEAPKILFKINTDIFANPNKFTEYIYKKIMPLMYETVIQRSSASYTILGVLSSIEFCNLSNSIIEFPTLEDQVNQEAISNFIASNARLIQFNLCGQI